MSRVQLTLEGKSVPSRHIQLRICHFVIRHHFSSETKENRRDRQSFPFDYGNETNKDYCFRSELACHLLSTLYRNPSCPLEIIRRHCYKRQRSTR
jgi:hypothetical protein